MLMTRIMDYDDEQEVKQLKPIASSARLKMGTSIVKLNKNRSNYIIKNLKGISQKGNVW
jgi:hypothetical protein